MDSSTNTIHLTALASGAGTMTAPANVTIVGTLPDGTTQESFQFSVVARSCSNQVFTVPSTWADQVYYIKDSLTEYTFPDFQKSLSGCSEVYENSISPANTWITGVSDYGGVGNTVGWQSIDESDVDTYTI